MKQKTRTNSGKYIKYERQISVDFRSKIQSHKQFVYRDVLLNTAPLWVINHLPLCGQSR